jgi:hypothetical protein
MKHLQFFFLALILFSFFSCAQSIKPIENVKAGTKDTFNTQVPNSMVRSVRQARNGDILIASFNGVFRYDGKIFTNITSAIPSPSFWDVLEDRKGNLWFGSRDSGVYLLPFGEKTFQHFTTENGLSSNAALHIYEDKARTIWIGSDLYDGKSFKNLTQKDGYPSNKIRLLLEDKAGRKWFGAQQEDMFVHDPSTKAFTILKNKDGKAFNNVWSVIEDAKGKIWFGGSIIHERKGSTLYTEDGLWRCDGNEFTKVADRGAYAIIQDKEGNIWTTGGLKPDGDWVLTRYNGNTLYHSQPELKEIMALNGTGALLDILEAKDGSIWFGAVGQNSGVYRYDGKTFTDFKNNKN